MENYNGKDRRARHSLTEDQIQKIADAAAQRAVDRVYAEIGRNVVKKTLWFLGAVVAAAASYITGQFFGKP